jgi:hypothetical protein
MVASPTHLLLSSGQSYRSLIYVCDALLPFPSKTIVQAATTLLETFMMTSGVKSDVTRETEAQKSHKQSLPVLATIGTLGRGHAHVRGRGRRLAVGLRTETKIEAAALSVAGVVAAVKVHRTGAQIVSATPAAKAPVTVALAYLGSVRDIRSRTSGSALAHARLLVRAEASGRSTAETPIPVCTVLLCRFFSTISTIASIIVNRIAFYLLEYGR